MIRFEEHDDNLFRMLEEPVPLTDDAELPVLVRLIQDDTMLGKANKRSYHPDTLAKKIICSSSNLTDDGLFMDGNYTYCYEIIGTLVAEGSDKWALYQMMQGEKICHHKAPSIAYYKRASKIMREVRCGCVDFMSIDAWLNGADKSGWQIYEEPKPTFKVGDWVDCKDPVGVPTQCKVLEILEHNVIVECKTGHRWSLPHNNITRKLSPSEIIVNIGCMSGTVKDLSYVEDGIFWFIGKKTERCPGVMHAILYGEMLDTETRELVEGLLKAQEEEK